MSRTATPVDFRRALAFDVVGALAIGSYTVMSFFGPVPFWAQLSYLGGAVAAAVSAIILRNYFSLACFVIMIACALPQVIFAT